MNSRTNWLLVWLLWAAGLGAGAQYGKLSVTFHRLSEIYPDADAFLGFAVSLVGFLGILLGVVAGVFVARAGYRRSVLAALAVGAAMSVLQATFPPMAVFLASRLLEGAAHLAIVVAAPTLIAQNSASRDSGRTLTLWSTFFGVSFAVLAWVGLPFAESFGLEALMLVHAAFMVTVALALLALPPPLESVTRTPRLAELALAHRRIYSSARIGAPAFGWFSYTFCYVGILTVLPLSLPEGGRIVILGAMPLVSILSSMTLGILLLRLIEAVSVIVAGFAVCAAAALSIAAFPGSTLPVLMLGVGFGLVQGATFASVPQLNETSVDRALANGGLAQVGNLGNTVGTPVMLATIGPLGYGGLMLSVFLVFCAGAAIHLALRAVRQIS